MRIVLLVDSDGLLSCLEAYSTGDELVRHPSGGGSDQSLPQQMTMLNSRSGYPPTSQSVLRCRRDLVGHPRRRQAMVDNKVRAGGGHASTMIAPVHPESGLSKSV